MATGQIQRRLADPSGPILRTAISPDGRLVATTAAYLAPVLLWDADSGQVLQRLSPPLEPNRPPAPEPPPVLAFSPRGDRLATAYSPAIGLHIWDTASGQDVRHLSPEPAGT